MCTRSLLQKCSAVSYKPVLARHLTTAKQPNPLTTMQLNPTTGIATLKLNNPPANALSLELMEEIKTTMDQLDVSKIHGLIITSDNPKIFCAGLDLNELYAPNEQRLPKFWRSLQDMWLALFSTPITTAALINGHATAGGCLIACCCDYRVMLPHFKIGLNETRVGIAVPKFVIDTYENVMPNRRVAEQDLLAGKLYDSEDATTAGLVDDLAHTHKDALHKCVQFFDNFKKVETTARAHTKLSMRADVLKSFEQERERSLELSLENILRPDIQEFIGKYLYNLKNKPKK